MYQVLETHRAIYVDVDDTLTIAEYERYNPKEEDLVLIKDPDSDLTRNFMIHRRHIEVLKQFKARGHTIIVWSQGGYRWAETVVKTLGLQEIVSYVVDKPAWFIDDLPAEAFMGVKERVYLHPTDPTKDHKRYGN